MVMTVVTVVTVVAIMAVVINPIDIVVAVMRMTIYLGRMSVVTMLVESGWMAMMAGLNLMRSMLHWYHPMVELTLKRWMRNGRHDSLFHFLRSMAVPYL